jgi:hypothetical protein
LESKEKPNSASYLGGYVQSPTLPTSLSAEVFDSFLYSELLLLAADFSRFTDLSHRAGRGVANLFIFALPVATFFHLGYFTRMTDLSETLAMLFLCSTVAGFSWLAGHGLRLIATIVEYATADRPVWMFPARLGRASYRMPAESLLETSRSRLIRRMRSPSRSSQSP